MQKYTEAESRTNLFVLPRRRQYFCRRQIYAEAESNANEFALACFEQRSREASGSRIRRAKQACKPGGLHCRGVNRISARQGKYRRSREGHGMPRNEGTGARFVPGKSATVSRHIDPLSPEGRARDAGRMAVEPRARLYPGGKCYDFAANLFTFPERTGEECRQNGRRAESAIPPLGESATVSRQIDSHLPPPKKTNVRLSDQYDRGHSLVFYVARAGAIYENCWSSRKLSVLRKRL